MGLWLPGGTQGEDSVGKVCIYWSSVPDSKLSVGWTLSGKEAFQGGKQQPVYHKWSLPSNDSLFKIKCTPHQGIHIPTITLVCSGQGVTWDTGPSVPETRKSPYLGPPLLLLPALTHWRLFAHFWSTGPCSSLCLEHPCPPIFRLQPWRWFLSSRFQLKSHLLWEAFLDASSGPLLTLFHFYHSSWLSLLGMTFI